MLHALGITHVVSVGECALVPPPEYKNPSCSPPRERRASLWIEEREGRIKVLDIQGVCDDGIDTLEHQLGPICDWIERARLEGGQVLVHCRVGVSRSATVTVRSISPCTIPSPHGYHTDRLCDEAPWNLSRGRVLDRSFPTALGPDTTKYETAIQPPWLGAQVDQGTVRERDQRSSGRR